MVQYDTYKDDNFFFKYNNQDRGGEVIIPLKAFVVCKVEPPSCFCKTEIFWFVPLIHNKGNMMLKSMNFLLVINISVYKVWGDVFYNTNILRLSYFRLRHVAQ